MRKTGRKRNIKRISPPSLYSSHLDSTLPAIKPFHRCALSTPTFLMCCMLKYQYCEHSTVRIRYRSMWERPRAVSCYGSRLKKGWKDMGPSYHLEVLHSPTSPEIVTTSTAVTPLMTSQQRTIRVIERSWVSMMPPEGRPINAKWH